MKLRKWVMAAIGLVMAAGLAACGTSGEETAAADQTNAEVNTKDSSDVLETDGSDSSLKSGGEIVVWTFLNPADESGRGKVLAGVIADYEEKYGIEVKVESLQWDTLSAKFLSAHQTNTAPDVIFLNSSNLAEAMKVGALEPLDALFLDEWSEEEIEDIDDARFQMGVTDGAHYQEMFFANTYGIIYRKDLFEEKGIDPNFESWEELKVAAEQLTYVNEEGNQIYGLGTGYSESSADSSLLMGYLYSKYGGVTDGEGNPVWTSEEAAEILQMQVDLIDEGVMPSSALTSTSDEVITDFAAGKYAMITAGTVRIATLQAQCVFDPEDIGIVPFPDEEGQAANSFVAGWSVGVWSGSEQKEAAGRFIEMMLSSEADEQWVMEGGQIPFRKSTTDNLKDYFEEPENQYILDALEMLGNAAFEDARFVTSGYKADINRAMQYAYADGYSIEEALSKTAEEFKEANQ